MPRRCSRTHACTAPDCRNEIPSNRLMCRPHWAALPEALRVAITHTARFGARAAWLANVREAERLLAVTDAA